MVFALVKYFHKITRWSSIALAPLLAFNMAFFGAAEMSKTLTPIDREDSGTDDAYYQKPAENEKFNILLLGEDEAAGLTDVVIIVSCDTKSGEINLLQIPRDTYAEYTSSAYRKINAASDILGGGEKVADFFAENLGVKIDRYVSFGLEAVSKTVDVLGGVEVDVPVDMIYSDPYQDLSIEIKKGRQILDGEKAKQFVRYRHGFLRGDLDRLDTQKIFMSALLKKISEQSNLYSVIEIMGSVFPLIEGNISYNDCFELVKKIDVPDMDKISFVTLPGGDIQGSSGAWYYIMNRKEAYSVIKKGFSPELDENAFDKNRKFTSTVRSGFNEIYEAEIGYKSEVFSAQKLNGGNK